MPKIKMIVAFKERICPVCKKQFMPAVYHSYRNSQGDLLCSYKCKIRDEKKDVEVQGG